MELGGTDKLGGLQGWRGPVSCSLSERNVRGMGWPWVVGGLWPGGFTVPLLCVSF